MTGTPLGVAGAGLATSLSVALGVALMYAYFRRLERFVVFDRRLMVPRWSAWRRILSVGLPPGGEFALVFVYMGVIYWAIRGFGPEAQAGFGVGSRVMQAVFLPAMAIAFATAPVAGQNVTAGKPDRVRGTFRAAVATLSGIMILLTLLCQIRPGPLVAFFTDDPAVVAVGAEFLRIISLNFVASGVVFTCSGMFQALGNTLPSLVASATRIVTFALPAVWLSTRGWFELRHLWYVSVATVALQAGAAWWLLFREMESRLEASGQGGGLVVAPAAETG